MFEMESGDHLGNLFDDMVEEDNDEDSFEEPACEDSFDSQEASSKANEPQNDSFDEPIQSSVSKQSDDANGEDEINEEVIQEQKELDLNEEDFNLLTIGLFVSIYKRYKTIMLQKKFRWMF